MNDHSTRNEGNIHNMQDADKSRQAQEPWLRFQEHTLDFIHLRSSCSTLLLGGFLEPMRHRGKHLKLEERHRLEVDMQWKTKRGRINFDILRSNVPKIVGVDDWLVEALAAGLVSFTRNGVNVYHADRQNGTSELSKKDARFDITGGSLVYGSDAELEIRASVRF